jgi:hypothetical protein
MRVGFRVGTFSITPKSAHIAALTHTFKIVFFCDCTKLSAATKNLCSVILIFHTRVDVYLHKTFAVREHVSFDSQVRCIVYETCVVHHTLSESLSMTSIFSDRFSDIGELVMEMIPVSYFPVATQKTFDFNLARITDKPYVHFFHRDLYLCHDVLPALQQPMDRKKALSTSSTDLNSLLDPGYHDVENGYCELDDGSAYVASRTVFPKCTGDMFSWWFWWHAVEPERYSLWYPYNHVSVRSLSPELLTKLGLMHQERYIGTTHLVTEYIGPQRVDITISFVDPSYYGFDVSRFPQANIVSHACGEVWLQKPSIRIGTMIHLARKIDDGFELRSRYWLADSVKIKVPLLGYELNLDGLAQTFGLKSRLAGLSVGYEQLVHDQIEFTNLASILPENYQTFCVPSTTSSIHGDVQ